jgi:hypothetical protein
MVVASRDGAGARSEESASGHTIYPSGMISFGHALRYRRDAFLVRDRPGS